MATSSESPLVPKTHTGPKRNHWGTLFSLPRSFPHETRSRHEITRPCVSSHSVSTRTGATEWVADFPHNCGRIIISCTTFCFSRRKISAVVCRSSVRQDRQGPHTRGGPLILPRARTVVSATVTRVFNVGSLRASVSEKKTDTVGKLENNRARARYCMLTRATVSPRGLGLLWPSYGAFVRISQGFNVSDDRLLLRSARRHESESYGRDHRRRDSC